MGDAFFIIHGYRIYIVLLAVKLIALGFSKLFNRRSAFFVKMSKAMSHLFLIVVLTDMLCKVHVECYTLGDNIRECQYKGITTMERLLDRVDYEGWLGYTILFLVSLIFMMVENAKTAAKRIDIKAIGLICVTVTAVIIANFINSFSVYEYSGLECEGISQSFVMLVSALLYGGDAYYLYDATNIASLMAVIIYISLINLICISGFEGQRAYNMAKLFRNISYVVLALTVFHFFRDMFVWMNSYAYSPLVVAAFVLAVHFRKTARRNEELHNKLDIN